MMAVIEILIENGVTAVLDRAISDHEWVAYCENCQWLAWIDADLYAGGRPWDAPDPIERQRIAGAMQHRCRCPRNGCE